MRSSTKARAFVAVVASSAFLWALALAVSPQLHERIHPDATQSDHSCAITFIASGCYSYSPNAPLFNVPTLVDRSSAIPTLTPQWVESAFLLAHIFAHAPPAFS